MICYEITPKCKDCTNKYVFNIAIWQYEVIPFIIPYLLFKNTISVTKFNTMISGLVELGSSYEWVVTKKQGRTSEPDLVTFC